jgi:hypothetical protein
LLAERTIVEVSRSIFLTASAWTAWLPFARLATGPLNDDAGALEIQVPDLTRALTVSIHDVEADEGVAELRRM